MPGNEPVPGPVELPLASEQSVNELLTICSRWAAIIFAAVFERVRPVCGCEAELREALINLVFNAVDAIEADGTITCRTFQLGRRRELRIVVGRTLWS